MRVRRNNVVLSFIAGRLIRLPGQWTAISFQGLYGGKKRTDKLAGKSLGRRTRKPTRLRRRRLRLRSVRASHVSATVCHHHPLDPLDPLSVRTAYAGSGRRGSVKRTIDIPPAGRPGNDGKTDVRENLSSSLGRNFSSPVVVVVVVVTARRTYLYARIPFVSRAVAGTRVRRPVVNCPGNCGHSPYISDRHHHRRRLSHTHTHP